MTELVTRPTTGLLLRWVLITVAAVVGGVSCGLFYDAGVRAALSFEGGLAMVVGAFEFGAFNIRFTGRYLPNMTLLVAMVSYATTAIAFGLVLAASSPDVVHGPATAIGLFTGLTTWLGTEIARSRVRS